MEKYLKEFVVLLMQIFMFYIFPLFADPTDAMGMVLLIIIATFILSMILGVFSNLKIKYFYPVVISLVFIPSVFIYYNESALVHALWYFIISVIGLVIGIVIKFIGNKVKRR